MRRHPSPSAARTALHVLSLAAAAQLLWGCGGATGSGASAAEGVAGADARAAAPAAARADEPSAATEPSPAAPAPDPAGSAAADDAAKLALLPELAGYVADLLDELDAIPAERRAELDKLALFVKARRDAGQTAKITFICTHNSRRSHMGQLWATAAAAHFGVGGVETYSGGTEATAFNPRAVASLERAGFRIEAPEVETDNPRYMVSFAEDGPEIEAFSKIYSDAPNPQEDFAAIMTCSEADKNCPVVEGAVIRVAIPYVDPKEADGRPDEAEVYDARTRQIATEVFYVFRKAAA